MAKPPLATPETESESAEILATNPMDHDGDGRPGGAAPPPAMQTFLTTRHTDRYGPGGRFLDLSAEDAAPGLKPSETGEGPELIVPTADQLARRRPAP